MNKFKKIIILSILLILYILISTINYVQATTTSISNEVFRLHVIANSNSIEDQNLKYKVRDAILIYMEELSKNTKNKNEIINIINKNSEIIKNTAKNTILNNGFNYDVNINIGNYSFPTKQYGDIYLPSGYYDALRIEIGESSGENWWCVMFPPLCFIDVTTGIVPEESKTILKENLNEEEYALVSEDNNIMKFKFKLIEMFENINIALGNKDN